jgi:hypothetical protein
VLVAFAGLIGMLGRGRANVYAPQDDVPPPLPLPDSSSVEKLQYQGVASCASVACHHGNGPRGTKGSEYTTWIGHRDPHSRAYTVLFDKQSLMIQKNLAPLLKESERGKPPHELSLCLNCHVHPDFDNADHSERFSSVDGVGCESCHGPAQKWLSVHYTRGLTRPELYNLGMTNTKDVAMRGKVCAKCHVGWQESDVNHDLIAAGHPRLRFEYGAYRANYPARHWKVENDRANYLDFEARAWLVGQVISAKAAVDLLRYRADPDHNKPWPEFAEYGCFGCHHDLQDEAWRRKRGAGVLPWGTWYFALRAQVAGELTSVRPDDLAAFQSLQKTMAGNYPNRATVLKQAANVSQILDRWADGVGRESRSEKALQAMLATLVKDSGEREQLEWDEAAQRYLGIAAVYNALTDVDGKYSRDLELKNAVRRLAQQLSSAFPRTSAIKYDSPKDYKPDMLQKNIQELRRELTRRGVQ